MTTESPTFNIGTMSSPPPYSASSPSPGYSSDPAHNERRLVYQRRPLYDTVRDGIFVHKEDKVTLILDSQIQGTTLPEYGRRSVVSGTIILDEPQVIAEVKTELKGRAQFLTLAQGFSDREIFCVSEVLYTRDQTDDDCPPSLVLSSLFPPTFQAGEVSCPLPPSCDEILCGDSNQYARVSYSFTVIITKLRGRKASVLLGKNRRYFSVLLKYRPRSRPPRPVTINHSLLSTIKVCPEEWQQSVTSIEPRFPGSDSLQPISCQLFLPSVGVFELKETIPFHVQLVGPSGAFSRLCQGDRSHPPIKVNLCRQLVLDIEGRRVSTVFSLGEGKVAFAPRLDSGQHGTALNFEGQVQVSAPDITVPTFDSGIIAARDFVSVELSPKTASTTQLFAPFRHTHVAKLVTDPWCDVPNPFG
ncbi:hypothetical protein E1B28_000249 [Marasmius oreades]|uniref:Uncharacterized protein n=1 Tax=Marasmius oreades TaxID=181124 RepID=A0A9P7V0V6_9AGAR|nr:uncharacterized protein E1B28_000249 [Marasmius oreades]KAG7098286.1 hypothetical protein E1B28_000249 [Marasmius oreades]